jgi:hypothetical protein
MGSMECDIDETALVLITVKPGARATGYPLVVMS